jgi:hypothetical protein
MNQNQADPERAPQIPGRLLENDHCEEATQGP